MTFKDLQKLTTIQKKRNNNNIIKSIDNKFDRFNNIPFWIFDQLEHKKQDFLTKGNCCFNHLIGLPLKNNKEYPIFDYEKILFDAIEYNQHVWIKKSRGIGATEFILRYLAWKTLSSDNLNNKSIFLVSGTREEFANGIKVRLERLFERKFPYLKFDSKYTELTLGNNTWFKVFPTKRIQDLRGYTDVSYIFIDEADFFDPAEQWELEYVIKAYEEKSRCKIILTSTPNKPDSLFDKIERNEIFKDFFKKIFLDYTYGLGKIYDSKFIEREKKETYFEREYNLKYLGKVGNVFSLSDIEKAIELGEKYKNLPTNPYALHLGGIDPGFSSSVTALCIGEVDTENQIVRVIFNKEYNKAVPSKIASEMHILHRQIPNLIWFLDGSNRGFTNECRSIFGERTDWTKPEDINLQDDYVIPVSFGKFHKEMLEHTYHLLAKQKVAIPFKYDKLILSLKTAYAEDFDLDKERTVHNDHLDSFILLLRGVKFKSNEDYY